MSRQFLGGKVELHGGDSRDVLKTLADASVDSVVCDPPYSLTSGNIVVDFAKDQRGKERQSRAERGFMGKTWDTGETAFAAEFWAQVLRVLKPGGHLVAFSGTRTYHRLACAIEDAGFEIRDQLAWTYGSGFPKSHNIGNGYGTALKPAWEPIVLARKPLIGTVAANVLEHGTGAINIDGCRIEAGDGYAENKVTQGISTAQTSYAPAVERRTFEPAQLGRWPANLLHDGSEEVVSLFPDAGGQQGSISGSEPSIPAKGDVAYGFTERVPFAARNDSGSAARFFYQAKADSSDRLGSRHPTVKPVDLMQWLVRLVTPKNGVCLDPFAGTGTTGEAAWREGMRAILIEREEEYQADIARRLELAQQPTKRAAVAATKNNLDDPNSLPLFGGWPVAAE
jgi:DNA modification methylase